MRRRLYSPGGSSDEAVAEYMAAAGDAETRAAISDGLPPAATVESVRGSGRSRHRRARRIAGGCAALAVVAGLVLWWHAGRTTLPDRIAPPLTKGSTVLYYSRAANPESAPDKVTFEPADERMVFRADGHRLAVALRCIGQGRVRITVAEQPFSFRCDGQLRTSVQLTPHAVRGPFFIFGRTVGNVVWGMRVTSLPVSTISP